MSDITSSVVWNFGSGLAATMKRRALSATKKSNVVHQLSYGVEFTGGIMILLWISIPDLHFIHSRHPPILFGSANSFESYCVHMKISRTYKQTDNFFLLVLSSEAYKTWTFVKRREFFFFTYAITILSLFTYSVCDEKVKTFN